MNYVDLYKVKEGDILIEGTYEYTILKITDVDKDGLWCTFIYKKQQSSGLFLHNKYKLKNTKPFDKKQAVLNKIKYLDDRYANLRLRDLNLQQGEPI